MARKRITIGGQIRDSIMRDYVQALSSLGYRAMLDAYGQRGFQHRTRNLHDSYGSAVYVDGVLQDKSIRYLGRVISRKVDSRTKKSGRDTLNDYFRSHKFGKKNDIYLIVLAAMYYAEKLETGRGLRKKYIVISPAEDYIKKELPKIINEVNSKYGIKSQSLVIKGGQRI